MDEFIKLVAKYAIVVPVIAAAYVFIRFTGRKDRIEFVTLLAAGGLLSLCAAFIGSRLINDPRPFVAGHFTPLLPHGNDNGFPSDHTLLASFLGFAILRYRRGLGTAMLFVAACIGIARIAAGIHHLEDIIGSFIITGAAVLVVTALQRRMQRQREHNPQNG